MCVCVCVWRIICVCGEFARVYTHTHTHSTKQQWSPPLSLRAPPPPLSLFLSPPFSLSCTHTRILTLSRCLWPFSVLSFPLSPPLLQDGGVVLLLQVEEDTDVTGPVASETGAVCIM